VKAIGVLAGAIEQADPDPQVLHDARADEARGVEVGGHAVDLEGAGDGRQHAAREAPARERTGEDAPRDLRGAAVPARAVLVVDLEEARHEAGAHDEADARVAIVGHAQGRAFPDVRPAPRHRLDEPRRVACRVAAAGEEPAALEAPVARDRAHGAAGREGDSRQRALAASRRGERPGQRRDAGHVRAVTAGQDDRVRHLARELLGSLIEVGHGARLDDANAGAARPQHVE